MQGYEKWPWPAARTSAHLRGMKTMLWIVLSTCVHHDFPLSATMELPDTATQVCTKGAVIMSLTSFEETRSFLFRFLFSCVSFISCVCEC